MAHRNHQRESQPAQGRNAIPKHHEAEDGSRNVSDESKGRHGAADDHIPSATNANDKWEPQNSRGPRGYGHSQAYSGPLGYQDETLRTPETGQQHYDRVENTKPGKPTKTK